MPIYSYQALKAGKEIVRGEVTASNLKDAREVIRKMGLVPTQISEFNDPKNKGRNSIGSLSLSEKIDFISTLQILLSSGIPAVESLMFMEQEAAKKKIRDLSKMLKTQIMAGSTFADTLARYPQSFGYIFIGLAKAGEESGELEKTLGRIKDLLTKQSNTKAKVIGTLIYPVFVIILAFIITLVMLLFVFPAFKDMFAQQEKALPFITKVMIDSGDFLKEFWYTIPIFIIAFIAFVFIVFHWKPARDVLDKFVLKVPLLSNLIMYSNYSNFMSVFSVSYDAGIPVVDCLNLGVITLTNSVLKSKISNSITKVSQGLQVSQALKATKIMPKMLLFMVATGEQSGRLGDSLHHCVDFIDKKLDDVIEGFMKLIEPLLMVFIGLIVGFLGLALYLPLFQAYQT